MKLNKDDLVFMEKCLQRTLLEYEDFISATGTPTIICRRTGEVVAVGKEFSILTGWSANVLLGREPNQNINTGGGDSALSSAAPGGTGASTRGGTNTPRNPGEAKTDNPVNIVDLLDDDSVCDFFTDYAHLAFGDSRGSVITPCKLLKYRTLTDTGFDDNLDDQVGSRLKRSRDALARKGNVKDEASMRQLGKADGKVDCMLCWSVKRDVFDIPMLCVMNVNYSHHAVANASMLTSPHRSFLASSTSPISPLNLAQHTRPDRYYDGHTRNDMSLLWFIWVYWLGFTGMQKRDLSVYSGHVFLWIGRQYVNTLFHYIDTHQIPYFNILLELFRPKNPSACSEILSEVANQAACIGLDLLRTRTKKKLRCSLKF